MISALEEPEQTSPLYHARSLTCDNWETVFLSGFIRVRICSTSRYWMRALWGSPARRSRPRGQQSCWSGCTGRWRCRLCCPSSCSLWLPNGHFHSAPAPRRHRAPSPLFQGSLTVETGRRFELVVLLLRNTDPNLAHDGLSLGYDAPMMDISEVQRLCSGLRSLSHSQLHPPRTHMFEDKFDPRTEVLCVTVADKGRYDIRQQDRGDFLQQFPVCLMWNYLFLSIHDRGAYSATFQSQM